MTKSYDAVVCGGGFRGGICAALLAKSGKSVRLIEASPRLGGVLNSIPWKQYHLDIGCHLFDNSSSETTGFLFDIHKQFHPISVTYHGVMATDKVARDMAQPDLTLVDADPSCVLNALTQAINSPSLTEPTDYTEYLINRFVKYNADYLVHYVHKKVGVDPSLLCPSASAIVLMDRVRLLNDELAADLKKQPAFDERLALSSANKPLIHYPQAEAFYPHRNFYPDQFGMGGFCRSLERYLEQLGVEVTYKDSVTDLTNNALTLSSGETLLSDKVVWSNDLSTLQALLFGRDSMQTLSHPVAVVLVYFEVPVESVSEITYLHDYRKNSPCFRISTAGKYGNQHNGGNTYVCCEVFTQEGSPLWSIDETNYGDVWRQVVESGVVDCASPVDVKVIRHNRAYHLPKVGYQAQKTELLERLHNEHPDILSFTKPDFSKQAIYVHAKDIAGQCD